MQKELENKAKEIIHKLNLVFVLPDAKKLLKKEWRTINQNSGVPATGFCYIASEVLFHSLGGKNCGLSIFFQKIPQGTHWWIAHGDTIYDPTVSQLSVDFVYQGRKGSFLTTKPSKRAIELARIADIKLLDTEPLNNP